MNAPQNRIYLYPHGGREAPHYLDRVGTLQDIVRTGLHLSEGQTVHFWCDDEDEKGQPDPLIFEGTVCFDSAKNKWYALLDWMSFRHASQENKVMGSTPE
jgi:hypothetical protein